MPRFLLTVAFVAGCSEYNVSPSGDPNAGPGPDILLTPSALQFSELSAGEQEIQTFVVENVGQADLEVAEIVIAEGVGSFVVASSETEFLLAPGETKTIDVAFTPMGIENYGKVHVLSNDPDQPTAPVDLLGFGAVPELQITPEHHIFSDTFIPCGESVELELANVGSEVLTITDAEYSSGGLLSLDTSGVTLPLTLQPGEAATVTVDFSAATAGADAGELEVTSNDPRGVVSATQEGEGTYSETASETFLEPGIPPVDVMFLIDQSCSMEGDNKDDIENGIPGFVSTLQTVADWQLIQITQASGCANGGVLDASTPNAADLLIANAWNYTPAQDLLTRTEQLLWLADTALAQTGPGMCNDGFLRPGALLHIIIASDEKDHSPQDWSTYVSSYESYVSSPDLLKISGILDVNKTCGDSSGAVGYEDAVNATGGATLNICSSNWGQNLTDIATEVLDGIRTYNLADPAVDGSIDVTVNGTPTSDFSFDASTNSVTVNSPPIGEDDVVDVTYGVATECN